MTSERRVALPPCPARSGVRGDVRLYRRDLRFVHGFRSLANRYISHPLLENSRPFRARTTTGPVPEAWHERLGEVTIRNVAPNTEQGLENRSRLAWRPQNPLASTGCTFGDHALVAHELAERAAIAAGAAQYVFTARTRCYRRRTATRSWHTTKLSAMKAAICISVTPSEPWLALVPSSMATPSKYSIAS